MVKGVEGIHFEHELDALSNAELFAESHVKVVDTRLAQGVASDGSERTQSRLREAGRVNAREFTDKVVMYLAAGNSVGMHELTIVDALNIIRCNGEWEALWKVVMPLSCHPPRTRSAAR